MDIKHKELGLTITVKLDKKNYKLYLEELKRLGKKYEQKSNYNKLSHSVLINCQKMPYMKVKGWCSRVQNKNGFIQEVIFLDYDNILFRLVESELKYLMEEYNLSPFYVFKTSEDKDSHGEIYGNYLAICITKKTFREVIQLQNQLHCDQAYKNIPLIYRFKTWVLRLGNKGKKQRPEFKTIVGDLFKEYNQDTSKAHLKILNKLYPEIPKINYTKLDENEGLFLTKYNTASP